MAVDILAEGAVLLHPIRFKIIEVLKDSDTSLYIDEIAKKVGYDRRLVSFHLSALEDKGYLESNFEVIKKPASLGKAGRFYTTTEKVDEVLSSIAKRIEPRKD